MRLLYPVIALAMACTTTASPPGGDDDDDAPGTDAGEDPGVGCTPTSPRSVPLEAFVAPSGLQNRITSFIDSAQDSLEIAMYLWTVDEIADRVVAAKQRGVAVRVLLDPDHDGNTGVRSQLTGAGVATRNAPAIYSFSHQKYLIADGKTAIVMSANFNVDAMSRERNYGVIDRDPDDLADLRAIFEQDWAGAGGEPAQPADLACTRLIVSPSNARQRVLDFIASATQTLEVEALYVSELGVRDAIGAAKQRGVNVRVILESTSDNAETIAYFAGKGIPVHDASGFFNHAKLIIADGVAFVGSENYSLTSLTKNREVGMLVTEPSAAAVIQTQFDTDWANTQP
jgi:cardiolipin synthase A/B